MVMYTKPASKTSTKSQTSLLSKSIHRWVYSSMKFSQQAANSFYGFLVRKCQGHGQSVQFWEYFVQTWPLQNDLSVSLHGLKLITPTRILKGEYWYVWITKTVKYHAVDFRPVFVVNGTIAFWSLKMATICLLQSCLTSHVTPVRPHLKSKLNDIVLVLLPVWARPLVTWE